MSPSTSIPCKPHSKVVTRCEVSCKDPDKTLVPDADMAQSIHRQIVVLFFRPTPLGFRQVVPHVQLHVAQAWLKANRLGRSFGLLRTTPWTLTQESDWFTWILIFSNPENDPNTHGQSWSAYQQNRTRRWRKFQK